MAYTYKYPRPAVTVDCVIFGLDESSQLKVLLIQRANDPYKDCWALPGGFVDMDEDLETAALRELQEETGVVNVFVEQLYSFGALGRDPRGRTISVAYFALVNLYKHPVQAASDAKKVAWFDINQLPKLAFDHDKIMKVATERLRAKIRYQPIGFELLPAVFTINQLQQLYETILGVSLNRRNFRTRIKKMDILQLVGKQQNVAHRPANLYTFDKEKYNLFVKIKYEGLVKRGIDFEV